MCLILLDSVSDMESFKKLTIWINLAFVLCTFIPTSACNKIDIVINTEIDNSNDFHMNFDSLELSFFNELEDWHNMQGGAVYGDKLVCLMATDEMKEGAVNGFIYNLITGKKECDLLFTSTLNDRHFYKPHANQVSFSSKFYNEKSDFPLLYVSQVNGGETIKGERGVLVYNLEKQNNGAYSPVMVQAIIPDLEDELLMEKLGAFTPNYIVDNDKNQLVVMGYPQASWYVLDGPQPITIFNIPSLNQGNVVKLSNRDVIDSFILDVSCGIQQSCIKGPILYSSGGFTERGTIRIINLITKKSEKIFNLAPLTSGEPQFLGIWRNNYLYYEAGTSGIVYEILFK